jgi:hypothetical protein
MNSPIEGRVLEVGENAWLVDAGSSCGCGGGEKGIFGVLWMCSGREEKSSIALHRLSAIFPAGCERR